MQDGFGDAYVAREQAFDCFREQCLTKGRLPFSTFPDSFLEVSCQVHPPAHPRKNSYRRSAVYTFSAVSGRS